MLSSTIRSMTGYGSATREGAGFHILAEVRSVNHRYLKVSAHLPEELSWVQNYLEESARTRLARGAVSINISLERLGTATSAIIDRDRLRTLFRELDSIRRELTPEVPLRLGDLLALDGILGVEERDPYHSEELRRLLEEGLGEALEGLVQMQSREGAHLKSELDGIVGAALATLDRVERLLPEAGRAARDRYLARVREFLSGSGVEIGQEDIAREVAILAEKADITEELGRLHGHLVQFREALSTGGRIGRKLDFLAQEMFREANTMSSKASHRDLAREVLDLKADVDRLREQAQNIE